MPGHQHTAVQSCPRTRGSVGMCLASTHLSSSSSSRFTAPTTGGPWYTSAVYSCTSEAPARIFSRASCPLLTPPTPIMGTRPAGGARGQDGTGNAARPPSPVLPSPWVRVYISLMVCVDSSRRGFPLRPPGSVRCLLRRLLGRLTVVLLTISPSTPSCRSSSVRTQLPQAAQPSPPARSGPPRTQPRSVPRDKAAPHCLGDTQGTC